MRIFIYLALIIVLSSCSTILENNLDSQPEYSYEIEEFQQLLQQGWNIYIYEGKVVLTKIDNNSLLIKDVFNVLK